MQEKDDFETIDVPVEPDEATKIRNKRTKMCDEILRLEKNNINKTNKASDSQMARDIFDIVERFS